MKKKLLTGAGDVNRHVCLLLYQKLSQID